MADRAEIIEKMRQSGEGDLWGVYVLENQDVWNRFALVQLYRDIGWQVQAEASFAREKKRVGARLAFEKDRYAAVITALNQLEREIRNMKRPIVVNFQVVGDLAARLNVRARVTAFPKSEKMDASVTTGDLDITMIPGHQSDVSFRKEAATDLATGHTLSLSEGLYTVIIEVPELPILKPDAFPLRFVHLFRNMTFQEPLRPRLEITIRDEKGRETQVSLSQGSYTQAGDILINAQGARVTFPAGVARVRATAELQYLSAWGTIYGLHLQQAEGVRVE